MSGSPNATIRHRHERPVLANVPEIAVIDRRGIIRAIVDEFEEGEEARIIGHIERLLAEKP
jgi:hypothetical protein